MATIELEKKDIFFINNLLRQLNPDARPVTIKSVMKLTREPFTKIVIAKNEKKEIVGMASLHIVPTLLGLKGIIENVVVDEKHHRKGYGKRLMNKLIEFARGKGVERIELTSKPERHSANKRYEYLGFKQRETNVYRLE